MSIARTCKIENCNSIHKAKGYCSKHYAQLLKSGSTKTTYKDKRTAIIEGDIAKIPLGFNAKHGYAIVDKNFSWLDIYSWTLSSSGYAVSNPGKFNKCIRMHHMVLPVNDGNVVDHINRNKIDNRIANLRKVTHSQNLMNSLRNTASGYKGVHFLKRTGAWQAVLGKKTKCFKDKHEAAEYYNIMALEKYGEYAYLNEIRR